MFIYSQKSGRLVYDNELVGTGYSGNGAGLNNPAMQDTHDVGPIPAGFYTITSPYNSMHSPYTLGLQPFGENEMYGRTDFLIHGDLIDAPGKHLASLGCVIMPRWVRETVWNSGDHVLKVVSGLEEKA